MTITEWQLLIALIAVVALAIALVLRALGRALERDPDPEHDLLWFAVSPLFYVIHRMRRR